MVAGKLPPDSFNYYFALGEGRTYESMAAHFGCSKRAVTKRARRERWRERLEEIQRKARLSAEKKALETAQEMMARHLRALKILQGRALERLRSATPESATAAARILLDSLREERTLCAEPGQRGCGSLQPSIFDLINSPEVLEAAKRLESTNGTNGTLVEPLESPERGRPHN